MFTPFPFDFRSLGRDQVQLKKMKRELLVRRLLETQQLERKMLERKL
jgi:hypothetical protein